MLVNKAICCIFGYVDPFTMNRLPSLRKRNENPCVILQQGRILFCHGNIHLGIPTTSKNCCGSFEMA
jgi:hypothetical protein